MVLEHHVCHLPRGGLPADKKLRTLFKRTCGFTEKSLKIDFPQMSWEGQRRDEEAASFYKRRKLLADDSQGHWELRPLNVPDLGSPLLENGLPP